MLASGCNKDKDATKVCMSERKWKDVARLTLEFEVLESVNSKQWPTLQFYTEECENRSEVTSKTSNWKGSPCQRVLDLLRSFAVSAHRPSPTCCNLDTAITLGGKTLWFQTTFKYLRNFIINTRRSVSRSYGCLGNNCPDLTSVLVWSFKCVMLARPPQIDTFVIKLKMFAPQIKVMHLRI